MTRPALNRKKSTVRRTALASAGVLSLALVAGCGSSSGGGGSLSTDPVAAVQKAASATMSAGSSKIALMSTTKTGAQSVTFNGTGAFDTAAKKGNIELSFTIGSSSQKIEERLVGDEIFIKVPMMDKFYEIKTSDLVGTSLASSTSPTSSFAVLEGVSSGVTKVGKEDVRGTSTTHYTGTLDPQQALAKVGGAFKDLVSAQLKGVTSLPFDVYLDDQGRIRRFVEKITLSAGSVAASSTTTLDLFDYGTKVDAEAPPAAEVQDGSQLLAALKGATGSNG